MSYNENEIMNVPKEKLKFTVRDNAIHDVKFDTKPVGYFKDALIRFSKNKGSIVAAVIILILLLFAIITPYVSRYEMEDSDMMYINMLPRSQVLSKFGIWDAVTTRVVKQYWYDYYSGIPGAIVELISEEEISDGFRTTKNYTIDYDCYAGVGYSYDLITKADLDAIQKYEKENNVVILEPVRDPSKITMVGKENDENLWYVTNTKGIAQRDKNGELVNIFLEDPDNEYGDGYAHYIKLNDDKYKIRVLYKEYYKYKNGMYASFLFGSDSLGYDLFTRLAGGARFSFLLGISVSIINIFIGVIYGSIEGYYGGWIDLLMGRISDILARIPFIVVATLFNMYLAKKVGVVGSIMFAFILTRWIAVANRTRTQFYRFKGSEHVLASRTLGAKDRRLIFKHILPNAVGTLITSCILIIPNVIFQESFLSYLGVIDLNSKSLTSIGTLLSSGHIVMANYPHIIFFPAVFISLLMISFNIFGNGLRDAFNPSLRGAEQ